MPPTSTHPNGPRLTRFVLTDKTVTRRFLYKIPRPYFTDKNGNERLMPERDKAYAALYPQLVKANGGSDKVFFRAPLDLANPNKKNPVVFNTDQPILARWLRNEIREKRLRAREDVTTTPMQCPWCDFTLPGSTDNDRIKMYEHHLEVHADKLDANDASVTPEESAA